MGDQVGVRELRADLASRVRRAAAGQEVVVTLAGRPVACLGPLARSDGGGLRSLDALVAAGLIVPPRRGGAPHRAEPVPIWSGVRLDKALRELRG